MSRSLFIIIITAIVCYGCVSRSQKEDTLSIHPDHNDGGITLPEGFHALVVIDNIGKGHHLVINKNGDIYMALTEPENGKGIVAMRDKDGDGKVDMIIYFGNMTGSGIDIYNGYLYFGTDSSVVRFQLNNEELLPDTVPEIVAEGFPIHGKPDFKSITVDPLGNLYVNIGTSSNACADEIKKPGSPGQDPCPLLERQGGIWRFSANRLKQDQAKDGYRYATGIRNMVALKWNKEVNKLYGLQLGRDQLSLLFPSIYSDQDDVNLPAEEFFLIEDGDDFGWPYCYYDPYQVKKVLAPEYGGNGKLTGRCEYTKGPILSFPAHIAPYSLVFYNHNLFPEKYKNGAFVAFHGAWNRTNQNQNGYFVAFIPFVDIYPEGQWEIFADGFAGSEVINNPNEARHRPSGLAMGPEGSLYVSDSRTGKIWRIFYQKESK